MVTNITNWVERVIGRPSLGHVWVFLSVLLRATASVCAKQAAIASSGRPLVTIATNPWYHAQLAVLALQAFCWIMALRRFPLSVAYPFMSLVFALNLVTARVIFREPVHVNQGLGILIIITGVLLIARGAQR